MNNYQIIKWNLLLLVCTSFLSPLIRGEITLDGSVGPAGTLTGPDYQVTENLGKRAGSNLFHSFGRFNLNSSESATFSGSTGIKNVISRVTGGQASNIDGTLRVSIPNANLYLLNPAGVIFGEHAKLDVPGSFHVSTADYLKLQDGVRFDSGSATAPQVLATAEPEAFGFLGENPAGISLTGTTGSVLEVSKGSTLSLIGGDITSENTAIVAPGGQINVASVGSAGEVILSESGIQTTSFEQMGNISLVQHPHVPRTSLEPGFIFANIEASGDTAGKVFIHGGQLVMDNSLIASQTTNGNGGDISIRLTGDLSLRAPPKTSNIGLFTGSEIVSGTRGDGNAGNINLDVAGLNLTNRTEINTSSSKISTGNAGNITVNVNTIHLQDNDPDDNIITKISSASFGDGDAGNITISTGTLEMRGEALIDSSTLNKGDGGDLTINVENLKVLNGGDILNHTEAEATSKGGSLMIDADSIFLSGHDTSISTEVWSGDGGDLTIKAHNLTVQNGALIDSSNLGAGSSGNLVIDAKSITLSGNGEEETGIVSEAFRSSTGTLGKLSVTADNLKIQNGASINTRSFGTVDGGDMTIAVDKLQMSSNAKISASTSGAGQGGDLIVTANDIILDDARLEATSKSRGIDVSRDPEIAKAGNIVVTPKSTFRLKNGSSLNVETEAANAGDITINKGKILQLSDSKISTSVQGGGEGNGGNIFISTPVVALDNSSIISQAQKGQGGNITITGFLFQSPSSVVSASSELGIDGSIDLNPDANISGSLAVLPGTFLNASQQMSERCTARSGNDLSSFVVKGRGGTPLSPGNLAPSNFLDNLPTKETSPQGKESLDHRSLNNDRSSSYSSSGKGFQFASMSNDCIP